MNHPLAAPPITSLCPYCRTDINLTPDPPESIVPLFPSPYAARFYEHLLAVHPGELLSLRCECGQQFDVPTQLALHLTAVRCNFAKAAQF